MEQTWGAPGLSEGAKAPDRRESVQLAEGKHGTRQARKVESEG
jgi:hypothetical protein